MKHNSWNTLYLWPSNINIKVDIWNHFAYLLKIKLYTVQWSIKNEINKYQLTINYTVQVVGFQLTCAAPFFILNTFWQIFFQIIHCCYFKICLLICFFFSVSPPDNREDTAPETVLAVLKLIDGTERNWKYGWYTIIIWLFIIAFEEMIITV